MTLPPHLGHGPAVFAFDVGGTDTKYAAVGSDGVIAEVRRSSTARSTTDPAGVLVDQIARLSAELRADYPEIEPAAIGLMVPGIVDDVTGVGVFSANLGWRNAPLAAAVAERTGLPVGFGHDVRAAGRAEVELGAARGLSDVVVLAIGTGIAGTIVQGGRPVAAGGYAGELGHTLADPAGTRCACGAVGCLETIASAGAIARRYAERTGATVDGARGVLALAQAGDKIAAAVWNDAVEYLAQHIARLAAVVAPQAVVIGGGLSDAREALFEPVTARVDELLSFHRRPRLLRAALGSDAGLLGSALTAREKAQQP